MPTKPKRPCVHPGCRELTTDGNRCPVHKKEQRQYEDRNRETATQRGYDSKWRSARAGYLKKHPLCAHCMNEGQLTEATVVDHIIPHKGDKALFWDSENNWQPLCKRHHDIKTATEDGGFGRPTQTNGKDP
ncbi:5-methylcytosine-specific restriction protein A [Paenibacillus sp. OAE614]